MKEQIAKEWIERGKHDLEVAKILLAEKEYSDVVLFHIHQAVEKYLKGFLIYKGWELKNFIPKWATNSSGSILKAIK
ncbi:MAG TPA: HEPN domain-containing protein [Methanophagales archaeon]|nr:HEPN domain-containing protein [Methanophagales archaeon]